MKRLLIFVIALSVSSVAPGHGVPMLVTTHDGALALLTAPPVGEFVRFADYIETEDPGIGVNFAATGPPAGTRLGIETLGGLLYWDGGALAPTDAVVAIEAPEFDSLNTPNTTEVLEYAIGSGTSPLTGMTWGRYPGLSFWDAHGYYGINFTAADGLYGVPMRLVDLAANSTLAPSEPFTLPLLLGPMATEQRQTGLDAFAASLSEPLAGDYDTDGDVDADDYTLWRADYGRTVTPGAGADGNRDGLVNAADYTVWRDAAATGPSLAIPEPATAGLVVGSIALCLWLRCSRPDSFLRRNLETS